MTQQEFLKRLTESKKTLFDEWFLEEKGETKYCQEMKKRYFTCRNISPYERFFLLECDGMTSDEDIVQTIRVISSHWSKLSPREPRPFCPYIYIHGISDEKIIQIKKTLLFEGVHINDGYEFLGADFSPISIAKSPFYKSGVKVKIINNLNMISSIMDELGTERKKVVFQFYLHHPFYDNRTIGGANIKINTFCSIQRIV